MNPNNQPVKKQASSLITILGPTATGKTKLAAKLANNFKGEIISADSRQVYKKMDIGTGKDLKDYIVDGTAIPHHLIDIVDPKKEFNLFDFIKQFNMVFADISQRNKIPFLVGGTGLYLSAVLQKYDLKKADFTETNKFRNYNLDELKSLLINLNPKLHNTTDLIDRDRITKAIIIEQTNVKNTLAAKSVNSFNIGVRLEREQIKKRITERLKLRLSEGMIEEVQNLIKDGITVERLKLFGLEYKFIAMYLNNELSYNDMFQKLNSAIHNFAKRQMTWFRKMEKEGLKINWIDGPNYEQAKILIEENFNFK